MNNRSHWERAHMRSSDKTVAGRRETRCATQRAYQARHRLEAYLWRGSTAQLRRGICERKVDVLQVFRSVYGDVFGVTRPVIPQ